MGVAYHKMTSKKKKGGGAHKIYKKNERERVERRRHIYRHFVEEKIDK